MKMKHTAFIGYIILLAFLTGCYHDAKVVEPKYAIRTFEACAEAGYPVMESYPRQCAVPGGGTFTEVIAEGAGPPDEETGEEPEATDNQVVGGDRDEHGCKASAGYRWCEATRLCQRFWEEPCESELQQDAEEFCEDDDVSAAYVCGESVKVVSRLPGGGATYHSKQGGEIRCPVVAPDMTSEDCIAMLDAECEPVCEKDIEDHSERAQMTAIEHVKGLPAYKDFNGRNIVSGNVQVLRCPGCYDVEVVFERDSVKDPDSTTRALMHVKLSNWEVSDVTSTYEEI
ncbi:MAG: hypothetical protein KKD17_00910 [Nanoarchaeota archaeon]|nr:hypothetical protein [Nanoarchaeota archaeon]